MSMLVWRCFRVPENAASWNRPQARGRSVPGAGPGRRKVELRSDQSLDSSHVATTLLGIFVRGPCVWFLSSPDPRLLLRTPAVRSPCVLWRIFVTPLFFFPQCDMSHLMNMRKAYKEDFGKKHGIKLGFMSCFVKASADALREMPAVNGCKCLNRIVRGCFLVCFFAINREEQRQVAWPATRDQRACNLTKGRSEFKL